jgi:DNA-binding response OmpR family regulator
MVPQYRIALIDDNRSWVETLSQYLRDQGWSPVTAEDGVQGLALLEDPNLSLAIIDLNMPGMDGLELLRQLRRRRRQVAVLVVSSQDDPATAKRALAEGARAFLPRNTSPRAFLRAVRQALDTAAKPARPQVETPPLWQRLLPAPRRLERLTYTSSQPGRQERASSYKMKGRRRKPSGPC